MSEVLARKLDAPAGGAADWPRVRGMFRLSESWIHMANFVLGSTPEPVRAAIRRWSERIDANPLLVEDLLFGSGMENIGEQGTDTAEAPLGEVKRALAHYLGGRPSDLALVPNTTTGLALVYHGLRLRSDQELLTTSEEHYSHHESARRAAERAGAAVSYVDLFDDPAAADAQQMTERLRAAITPRTRAVGLTWVSSATGVKLPIPELAAVVAEANRGRADADRCLLIVDGTHGFGVEDADAAALGADFFVSTAAKWFLGPRGTGLVWGAAHAWPHLAPTIPSFEVSPDLYDAWARNHALPATRASFVSPGGFTAYEHTMALIETVALHERIGRANIADRIRELNAPLRHELAANHRIRLLTPLSPGLSGGIACFQHHTRTGQAVVDELAGRRIIAATSPYPRKSARLAAGIMNSPDDIEIVAAALRSV